MQNSRRTTALVVTCALLMLLSAALIVGLKLSAYRVGSGSMEPDFPVGTIVIDSGVVPLEPGRAATFVADGSVVTHVLVGYNDDGSLVTRGTANASNDAWHLPVRPHDVRGRVLLGIPLFAPSFWMSQRGIMAAGAGIVIIISLVLWRHIRQTDRGLVLRTLKE